MSARPSTDEESAPLLAHRDEDDHPRHSLFRPARPLTLLEKLSAAAILLLLTLSAIFIGLFAGTQHKLSHPPAVPPTTVTATSTVSATSTVHATSTVYPTPTGKSKKVCLTKDCVLLAAEILESLDETVDPCDDFYQYANGGWLASNTIPPDRGSFGAFEKLQIENRKIILEILEGSDSDDPVEGEMEKAERENLGKLRQGYRACMDLETIDAAGTTPLIPLVNEITDLLGPFLLPSASASAAAGEGEGQEWEGAWEEGYEVPDHLRVEEDLWAGRKSRLAGGGAPRSGVGMGRTRVETSSEQVVGDLGESRKERLTSVLAFLHSRAVDALFGFYLEGDAAGEDPQVQGLVFGQTSGGLPAKAYYEEPPILDLYTRVVGDVLRAVSYAQQGMEVGVEGWPKWPGGEDGNGGGSEGGGKGGEGEEEGEERLFRKLAGRVVRFEKELIMAGGDPEDLFNPHLSNNPYSLTNLTAHLPSISLPTYLSSFAPRSSPSTIIVTYPPYLASLSHLLSSTPDDLLSAYLVTRLALRYSTLLGPGTPVRQATRVLQETLQGLKRGTVENRQVFCQAVGDDIDGLGFLGGREYVERRFGGGSKEKAEAVIYGVIDAFKARMPHLSWMDSPSATAAIGKADALLVKIGYPTSPNVTDPIALQRYFAPLRIDGDFFGNGLRTRILAEQRSWQMLGRVRNRGSWEMVPQLVNAYYSPPDGEIVFPAGILQPPFFSADWPAYLTFGGFGSVAAHELTHAFDNTGAQYDEKGRLRDWWTNSTVKAFEEKAQCIARTYSNYSIPGPDGKPVFINGNLTNGEDLGDSGITFAYSAWESLHKTKGVEATYLPGLDLTEEQLFFVSSARVWAQNIKPESALSRIRTDPHSPNYWRSNGQLAGFPKFAEAFGCKAGSKLNPRKRCDVWAAEK